MRHFHTDATASDDDVALDYLPRGDDADSEAMEGYRGDAGVDTEV